ncbi:MAG TPA: MBL fold metallo-hydrolase [Hanamia sp.]|nr:MBL fold metallo-hydrolase [Hanamia sp.]
MEISYFYLFTVIVKNISYKKPYYIFHKISFLCSSMSLFITSLNSGSNGNCYYVGNNTEAILVDAGISCREIEKRMKRLGLKIENVKAVFISHEHTDHINGLPTLIKKYQIPVYITPLTMKHGGLIFEEKLIHTFVSHHPVIINGLSIIAFPKFHDASDPYSFVISCDGICVGVFTDIGAPCRHVKKYFQRCHAAFLEANYDEEMLEKGGYPVYLKNRIRGGMGHLSNKQALELFISYRPKFMNHLIMSHLSKNNNSPGLVQQLFDNNAGDVRIIIASRDHETEVFHIDEKNAIKTIPVFKRKKQTALQLSFSFS